MENVVTFVTDHWQFISLAVGLVLGWFGLKEKFHKHLGRADRKYESAKQWAMSKDLYKAAKTAYGVVAKISRKTENGIDDKIARGLEEAIKVMEKLGWDKNDLGDDQKDVIRKVFDELHENEHLKLEVSAGTAMTSAASSGRIAAPLE